MKRSMAGLLTIRLFIVFSLILVMTLTSVYVLVRKVIIDDSGKNAENLLYSIRDTLADASDTEQHPINEDFIDTIFQYGKRFCNQYNVEYVYLYYPTETSTKFRYFLILNDQVEEKLNVEQKKYFRDLEYELLPEEQAVLNGESDSAIFPTKNDYGNEMTAITRLSDSFGSGLLLGIDISYDEIIDNIDRNFLIIGLIFIAIYAILFVFTYVTLRRKISRPAKSISSGLKNYINDGIRTNIELPESGYGEFAMISSSFNRMTKKMDEYVADLTKLSDAQAKHNAEIGVAGRIQTGLLPGSHYENDKVQIDCFMKPAKDIGGDLYDFYMLDDERLLTVIADVSGKGIPAAMFMAISVTLIRQLARINYSPAAILTQLNRTLAERNPRLLFVTTFVGIYNTRTKEYTFSNAGHNLPYLVSDTVTALDGEKRSPIGLFEDEEYTDRTIKLKPGEIVFLYTDGINEATDINHELFGNERLEQSLLSYRVSGTHSLINHIRQAVTDFTKGAEQSDDIAMVALTATETQSLLLQPVFSEFPKIKEIILSCDIRDELKRTLCLAAEEWFSNVCEYGYTEKSKEEKSVLFSCSLGDTFILRFEDEGIPFDPGEDLTKPEEYDLDNAVGGLGNMIIYKIADNVGYVYEDGKNKLTIEKYYKGE